METMILVQHYSASYEINTLGVVPNTPQGVLNAFELIKRDLKQWVYPPDGEYTFHVSDEDMECVYVMHEEGGIDENDGMFRITKVKVYGNEEG